MGEGSASQPVEKTTKANALIQLEINGRVSKARSVVQVSGPDRCAF